jgi:hypothetical protein
MRQKTVVKKRKVPQAIKISDHTDDEEASGPKSEPVQEKKIEKEPEPSSQKEDESQVNDTILEKENTPKPNSEKLEMRYIMSFLSSFSTYCFLFTSFCSFQVFNRLISHFVLQNESKEDSHKYYIFLETLKYYIYIYIYIYIFLNFFW